MIKKLALLPIALLLLAAGWCFRLALADVWATQVGHQLQQPSLTDSEWLLAVQMLRKTLRLAPDYAEYLDLAGQFYLAEAYRPAYAQDLTAQTNSLEKALDYFRQALRLNPVSPYLWDRLVSAKLNLEQFDRELIGALGRVARLGPWEKSLQYNVALIGLVLVNKSDPAGLDTLYRGMEQSLKMQAKQEQDSLMMQFKLKELCAGLLGREANWPVLSQRCAEQKD